MSNYDIRYEILDYDKLHSRLSEIESYGKFTKHENLGSSACGFPIEHYSVGNGPMHVVYMGACHGNEIITVDYITQLMINIGKGNIEFDSDTFTIDFIPVLNPEGYYVTTYALKQAMEGMNDEEIEAFCQGYFKAYSRDDKNAIGINKLLGAVSGKYGIAIDSASFWREYSRSEIDIGVLENYVRNEFAVIDEDLRSFIENQWNTSDHLKDISHIARTKAHNDYLKVNTDCIPLKDEAHKLLSEKVKALYAGSDAPLGTLGNFFANADGVNLNDNNEYYYKIVKDRAEKGIITYGNLRDNNLVKSKPGPIGGPVTDLQKPFEYTSENKALLAYLDKNPNYLFMNCHGTGGIIFTYPFEDEHKVIRDFSFYINNRIASDYSYATGKAYKEYNGENVSYSLVGYPESITGLGDVMRKSYKASLLLELSKMGGNPIGPYGDRKGNYEITIIANFEGFKASLETVKRLEPLYDAQYEISYIDGRAIYRVIKEE